MGFHRLKWQRRCLWLLRTPRQCRTWPHMRDRIVWSCRTRHGGKHLSALILTRHEPPPGHTCLFAKMLTRTHNRRRPVAAGIRVDGEPGPMSTTTTSPYHLARTAGAATSY